MAKIWLTALGGIVLSMLLLYLASVAGSSPFLGFPVFMISFGVLAYTGTIIKKLTGTEGWNLPKDLSES